MKDYEDKFEKESNVFSHQHEEQRLLLIEKDNDIAKLADKFNREKEELKSEVLKISQQNFETGIKNQNLEKSNEELNAKLENLMFSENTITNVTSIVAQVNELDEENENLKKEKKQLELQLISKYSILEAKIEDLSNQLTDTKTEKDKAILEYNRLLSKNEDQKAKINTLNQSISELEKKHGEALVIVEKK